MMFYIILHCLQEYKAFLIIFSKKIFHESFILLQKLKKILSTKCSLSDKFWFRKWFRYILGKNLQYYYYVLRKLNFSKIYLTKIFPILFKFWHMIFYIIFHFWQVYHTFLLIFCEKKFHESLILLQKLKIRLSIKSLLPSNLSTKK